MLLALIFVATCDDLYAMRGGFHRQGRHERKKSSGTAVVKRSVESVVGGCEPQHLLGGALASRDGNLEGIGKRAGTFACNQSRGRAAQRDLKFAQEPDENYDASLRNYLRRKKERAQEERERAVWAMQAVQRLSGLPCEIERLIERANSFIKHRDSGILRYLIDRDLMCTWLQFSADCNRFFEESSAVERVLPDSHPLMQQVDTAYGQLETLFYSLDKVYGAWVEDSYAIHFPI